MFFFFRIYICSLRVASIFLKFSLLYNVRGTGEHIINKYWKYQYKLAYVARLGDIGIVKKKRLQHEIRYIVFFKYNHFPTFCNHISTIIIWERFLHFSMYDPTGNKQPIKEYNEDTLTPPLPNTKMISHNWSFLWPI